MNRHHPYGGSFENQPSRRGGSPSGPGPDRSHRYSDRGGFRGRGFGRGRGYNNNNNNNNNNQSFEGNMSQHNPYDQNQTQGDMGPYNNYDAQVAPQNSYYQNNYGVPPAAPYASPQAAAYNQDYPKYEDGASAGYNDDSGYGRGTGVRRPIRKEKDDKVHDSIIEERIQRERPCRTLFIRNIKYETNSDDVRALFEEHGDIKTFFDLISTRGMVFVTYYDLRAAERARERLQGSEISNRPIDVHYSLPRDDHSKGNDRDQNQQLQGTLQVTLRNSATGAPLDDNEVRRKFQQFGDVKSIRPAGDRPESRYVEFYDTRACVDAHDRLRHQSLQDGVMDIVLAWDPNEQPQGQPRDRGEWNEGFHGRGNRGRGRGGGGRGRGRGFDDDNDRRFGNNEYGRFNRGNAPGRGGRQDDSYGDRGGGYGERYDRGGSGYGDASQGGYGQANAKFGAPPAAAAAAPGPPGDDRLEQARKVQQLLAALKQPQGSGAAGPPAPGMPAGGPLPGVPPVPPQPPNYYGQTPPNPSMPPYPGAGTVPPAMPYSNMSIPPPQSSAPGAAPMPHALSGLPPNIMAILQGVQQQRPQGAQGYSPPPGIMNGAIPPLPSGAGPAAQTQYQQLMGYLQSQAGGPQKQ